MDERSFFDLLLWAWFGVGAFVFVLLYFIEAPYGRYSKSKGWGPLVPARLAWIIMELPALVVYLYFFWIGKNKSNPYTYVFLGMWVLHYGHRALIYPLTMPRNSRPMPVSIALMGLFFNIVNGYIQGRYINSFAEAYPPSYYMSWNFVLGIVLFVAGFVINKHSDFILRRLKRQGDGSYQIPYGGMFRWVSSPNYFGELMEWIGWALASWSLAGAAFAFWTAANLVPRAVRHHKWYRQNFPNYPKERKAIIPFIY